MNSLTNQKKLSRLEILVFGAGDMYGGGAHLIIAFFYLIFLTDVVGLRPALAGMIVLISRIWDAVSDPLMGMITDNTRTRFGRRRPYLLAGSFAVVASFLMLWWPIRLESQAAIFAYVLTAYLFFSTVSTLVMQPYTAMSSELSMEDRDRTVINGTRVFFSQVSVLLCAVVPMQLVRAAPDIRTGYFLIGIVFGVFFAIPLLSIFFLCRERAPFNPVKVKLSFSTFFSMVKIRSFRYFVGLYLLAFLTIDILSIIFAFYMTYYIRRPDELEFVLGAILLSSIVFIPLALQVAKKFGKAQAFRAGAAIWILGSVLLGMNQPGWPAWIIYASGAVVGMGLSGCVSMTWTMFPDITDVGELYFGMRRSGSLSGMMTFIRKVSSALGIFLVTVAIEITGFLNPGDWYVEVITPQPQAFLIALRLIVALVPAVLLFFAILLAGRYPLSRQIHKRLHDYLEFQRGNASETSVSGEELEEIRRLLI